MQVKGINIGKKALKREKKDGVMSSPVLCCSPAMWYSCIRMAAAVSCKANKVAGDQTLVPVPFVEPLQPYGATQISPCFKAGTDLTWLYRAFRCSKGDRWQPLLLSSSSCI